MALVIRRHNGANSGTVPLSSAHNSLCRRLALGDGHAHADTTEGACPKITGTPENAVDAANALRAWLLFHAACGDLAHIRSDEIKSPPAVARDLPGACVLVTRLCALFSRHCEVSNTHYRGVPVPDWRTFDAEDFSSLISRLSELRELVIDHIDDAAFDAVTMARIIDA